MAKTIAIIFILLFLSLAIFILINNGEKIDGEKISPETKKPCDLSSYNPSDIYNMTGTGDSMLPTISNPANTTGVKIYSSSDISIGDIVMIAPRGTIPYIEHRLISINNGVYETRGDWCDGYSINQSDGSVLYFKPVCAQELWNFNQIKYKTICVNGYQID